ncbi:MAG: FAD-dependent tricarballylate dehydrogenase TcuA [Vicinamibacterales bacterium]
MPAADGGVDVAVLGGGNAALCAALTARESGARVVVLEAAPREMRGGNSRHTRNLRVAHAAPTAILTDAYTEDEFHADLLKVTGGRTDDALAREVIRASAECPEWMARRGARFQRSLRGTLHLSRTNAFFLGGGKALMNGYYAEAARLGIDVEYGAEVVGLDVEQGRCRAVHADIGGRRRTIAARAVVLAAGGFEANIDWLREIWGDAAGNFIVRGTPYNRGAVLRAMLDAGAQPIGDPKECHAVAVDGRAPRFDGGIVTRLDCVSLGVVVNQDGQRFYDEGEDFWPKRYAIWGGLVARQPGQIAFAIVDGKAVGRFMPSVFPPVEAPTIGELAVRLGLASDVVERTIAEFNAAVQPGSFDHAVLDDCRTRGLTPPKSHWALRIDQPPFLGYPLRPGITFTYLGLRVDARARVVMQDGRPAANITAAGEIMAGNVLGRGYVAGVGMTIGTVFGRIAGEEAARRAASV